MPYILIWVLGNIFFEAQKPSTAQSWVDSDRFQKLQVRSHTGPGCSLLYRPVISTLIIITFFFLTKNYHISSNVAIQSRAFSHWLRGQEKKKVGFFDSADSQRDGKSALSGFAQIWYKWKPLRHESFMPRSTKFCSLPLIPHKDPAKLSEYKILSFTPLSPIWLISKTDLSYLNWLSPPAISFCLKRTHGYS